MTISIVGPEGSGKSTLAETIAKKAAAKRRPIYYLGELKSKFQSITIEDFHKPSDAVVIVDDANAFLEHYDIFKEGNKLKSPIVMSRHRNRVNIFVFHSIDDAVKFFFRQSRFIYISEKYRDSSYKSNKFLRGIEPIVVGRKPYTFLEFRRH